MATHVFNYRDSMSELMNLKDYIRSIPNFPHEGILFQDITPLLANPTAFRETIKQMEERWQDTEIDAIAGLDARGFIFGPTLAYERTIPFVPIRKKGKLPFSTISASYDLEYGSNTLEIHTDAVSKGQRVLLLDDLLATGGTAATGCHVIEQLGGVVVGCQFVIELEALQGREKLAGRRVETLMVY